MSRSENISVLKILSSLSAHAFLSVFVRLTRGNINNVGGRWVYTGMMGNTSQHRFCGRRSQKEATKILLRKSRRHKSFNLVPRAFSSFKMAVGETSGQGCWNTPRIVEYFVMWHMMKWLFWRLFPATGGPVCFLKSETVIQTKRRHSIVFAWRNSNELSEPFWQPSARGFADRHFEREEGPRDKVANKVYDMKKEYYHWTRTTIKSGLFYRYFSTSSRRLRLRCFDTVVWGPYLTFKIGS